jgi:hypothetical protein
VESVGRAPTAKVLMNGKRRMEISCRESLRRRLGGGRWISLEARGMGNGEGRVRVGQLQDIGAVRKSTFLVLHRERKQYVYTYKQSSSSSHRLGLGCLTCYCMSNLWWWCYTQHVSRYAR